jgi:hypothetical protein
MILTTVEPKDQSAVDWAKAALAMDELKRRKQGDDPSAFAAINQEILVRGEYPAKFMQFRHAHQTRIGKAHRPVCLFARQTPKVGPLI